MRGPLGAQLADVIEAMVAEFMESEPSYTHDEVVVAIARLGDLLKLLGKYRPPAAPKPAPARLGPRKGYGMGIPEWVFTMLREGRVWPGDTSWPEEIDPLEFYGAYVLAASQAGETVFPTQEQFGGAVRAYLPRTFKRSRVRRGDWKHGEREGEEEGVRVWRYRLPSVKLCRLHYCRVMKLLPKIWGEGP
jgi:hypothetical protein